MDSDKKTDPQTGSRDKGIKALGIILSSAVSGSAVTVPVMRMMHGSDGLSAVDLMFSILITGVSVSAIILALVAISISRSAKRTIAQKSEEISALQKEIADHDAAAAARIESLVTRMNQEIVQTIDAGIEMLADKIQKNLPLCDVLRADIAEAVQHSPARSMTVAEQQDENQALPAGTVMVSSEMPVAEAVSGETKEQVPSAVSEPVADQVRQKAEKKYGEFKDIVLLGIANYPGVIARKIGEGHYRTEGDDLADGVFIIQNEKIAVCTFCTGDVLIDRFMGESGDSFNGFLRSLVNEIKCGHFSGVFMVFDGKLTGTSPYADALNVLSRRIDPGTFARFELFEGTPDVVIPELTERVSQLMEKPAGADPEAPPELIFRRQAGA